MEHHSPDQRIQPDAAELILRPDETYACETYIFEPSPGEEVHGFLFAAGETEDREGVGPELLDTVVTAMQREYYRDPRRSAESSFEMALHQANLILHDTAEQGLHEWMGYFHMAVGVLINDQLHISVAGGGKVILVRKHVLTEISEGLSHYPITNPLQTFSQVASGDVQPSDTLFFTTVNFDTAFRPADVTRFTLDHAAETISSRLGQLYKDQHRHSPLAMVTVSLLPQHGTAPKHMAAVPSRRAASGISGANIRPRQPLMIRRSAWQRTFLFIAQMFATLWQMLIQYLWPLLKRGSATGGRVLVTASVTTGRNLHGIAARGRRQLADSSSFRSIGSGTVQTVRSLPQRLLQGFSNLPRSSKIFGVFAIVLLVSLTVSLVFLQQKRAADAEIQRASEILHEARTKKDAAETALIYDNREQARTLLNEAQALTQELRGLGLYAQETSQLTSDIQTASDRLQRIVRPETSALRLVADISQQVSQEAPKHLFFVNDNLYTYNPSTNAILKIGLDGAVQIVHQTSQGIGFIENGVAHLSDKSIILSTNPAGIALFDTKDDTLLKQTIQLPSGDSVVTDLAVFGNRLYLHDQKAGNIFVFNKTLRGYSSGVPWIEDASAPKTGIQSLAIDGNIFALYKDGSIQRFFKGAPAEFSAEKVDPPLHNIEGDIMTTDTLQYIYILDSTNKRVIVFTKKGALVQQIFLNENTDLRAMAIHPDEQKLYALDGTRLLEVSLLEATDQ